MLTLTRKQYNEMDFDYILEQLLSNSDVIHDYDTIEGYAKYQLERGNIWVCIDILTQLAENPGYFYSYDFSMGGCDRLVVLKQKEDLEDYIYIVEEVG